MDGNVLIAIICGILAIIGIVAAAFILNSLVGQSLFNDFSAMLYHGDAFAKDTFDSGGSAVWGWTGNVLLHILPIFLVLAAIVLAALIILCREILVSGLREFLAELNVKIHVT